ncbi:MAG: formylglycine-generating enzyme family protein, partial [Candidatus Cloacimonadota bacterium]
YRLPTEAEWEYAARGGLNWEDNYRFSGISTVLNYVAWYATNSGSQSHEVGTKADNQLDIHDMSGNVWEWCNDWYSSETINPPSYYQTCYDQGTVNNPTGPVSGNDRVARGGGWYSYDSECRVAVRFHSAPNITNHNIGFRLVRTH